MTGTGSRPAWLVGALADNRPPDPVAPPGLRDDGPDDPTPGDIRCIDPMDAPGCAPRLGLVRDVDRVQGVVHVLLLTNETAMATPQDALIPRASTGLTYDLLAETDVQGPVWQVQLGPVLGRAPGPLLPATAVLALRDDADARWRWKEQELDALGALTGDCLRQLLDGPALTVVDPLCVDPRTTDRERLWHVAVHVAALDPTAGLVMPSWLLLRGRDGLPGHERWRAAGEADAWTVLQRAAASAGARDAPGGYEAAPPPVTGTTVAGRSLLDEDPLLALLADQVRLGARCVNVMTAAGLWDRTDRGLRHGAVLEARVGGARCQLLWGAVDAPGAHRA